MGKFTYDLGQQKIVIQSMTYQISKLLASIKKVRIDFAMSMKFQAAKFIAFLNLEAKLAKKREGAAAKASAGWKAGSTKFSTMNSYGGYGSTTTTYTGFKTSYKSSFSSYQSTSSSSSSSSSSSGYSSKYASTGYTGYSSSYNTAYKAKFKEQAANTKKQLGDDMFAGEGSLSTWSTKAQMMRLKALDKEEAENKRSVAVKAKPKLKLKKKLAKKKKAMGFLSYFLKF